MSRATAWSSSSRTSLVINRPERLHDTEGRRLVVEGERARLVSKESARLPQLRRKLLGALAVEAIILQRGQPKQVLDILKHSEPLRFPPAAIVSGRARSPCGGCPPPRTSRGAPCRRWRRTRRC